jgi:hypothetical protein
MTSAKSTDLQRDFEAHMNWMQSLLSGTDTNDGCAPSPLTGAPGDEAGQYRISDPVASDDEDECEDYYVEDAAQIRGQEIPDWARAANLQAELQKQQSTDPDRIFTNFDRTCDLSLMFEKKKRTFKVRGDSGWWAKDGLTTAEEANYKKAIGLA